MAKVTFKINNPKMKGQKNVAVRFQNGVDVNGKKIDYLVTTKNITVDSEFWDAKKGRVKYTVNNDNDEADFSNAQLDKLERYILKSYRGDFNNGEIIDKNWFKKTILSCFNQNKEVAQREKIYFNDYAAKFLKHYLEAYDRGEKLTITRSYILHFKGAVKTMELFDEYYKTETKMVEMEYEFLDRWIEFGKELYQSNSTSRMYFQMIKNILKDARRKNIPVTKIIDASDFVVKKAQKDYSEFKVYFSIEQLKKLNNAKGFNYFLRNTRDWMILQSWSGVRKGDLFKHFKDENLRCDADGEFFITQFNMQKTKKLIQIRFNNEMLEVLKRNNGKLPKVIDYKSYLRNIKKVCMALEFDKPTEGYCAIPTYNEILKKKKLLLTKGVYPFYNLVASHTCRRTFITLMIDAGMSKDSLQALMGYTSQAMLELYDQKAKEVDAAEIHRATRVLNARLEGSDHLKAV